MAVESVDGWHAPPREPVAETEALIVDVDGFEGPLDLLLSLGRAQKVDLRRISVLQLAEQYLGFVAQAARLRIELAADYLVMAAWLAYLKSRLLLPPDPKADGPSADDLAAHLAFQLQRLQAMRDAGADLMARARLGQAFFARGLPQDRTRTRRVRHAASLIDLMRAYARVRTRDEFRPFAFDRVDVYTMESALERLRGLALPEVGWAELQAFLPAEWRIDPARRRSATAAHFAALLELAKGREVDLRQGSAFGALDVRRRAP